MAQKNWLDIEMEFIRTPSASHRIWERLTNTDEFNPTYYENDEDVYDILNSFLINKSDHKPDRFLAY